MTPKHKHWLHVGISHYAILDETDTVVWKGYRTGMRSYRIAQAKLRDFHNAEKIARLADRIERKHQKEDKEQ